MSITTIKHCQIVPDYWFTVEDRNREFDDDETEALVITYHEDGRSEGRRLLAVSKDDALLIRDAINQLFPLSNP